MSQNRSPSHRQCCYNGWMFSFSYFTTFLFSMASCLTCRCKNLMCVGCCVIDFDVNCFYYNNIIIHKLNTVRLTPLLAKWVWGVHACLLWFNSFPLCSWTVLACPNGENFQEMVLRISYNNNNKQLLHELLHIKARDSLANGVSVKTIQVHCGILCVIIDQSRGSLWEFAQRARLEDDCGENKSTETQYAAAKLGQGTPAKG